MKKAYLLILLLLLAGFSAANYSFAAPFLVGVGGTGSTTPSGILYGDNGVSTNLKTVTIGSGCTFVTGTLACAGTGGTFGQSWELFTNVFGVSALRPTTTVPIAVQSTATSSFSGGLEAWRQIGTPYFHATGTAATSTISGHLLQTGGIASTYMSKLLPTVPFGTSAAAEGEGVISIDNTLNTNGMAFYAFTDQVGTPAQPLMILRQTDATNNQGLLWLLGPTTNTTQGGAFGVKVQDGNPDIEFVESDQTAPAGKYEIDGNNDLIRINGRNAPNNSFDNIAWFSRFDKSTTGGGGRFCIGCGFSDLDTSIVNVVGTTTEGSPYFTISSASTTAAAGDKFVVDKSGFVGIGTKSPSELLHLSLSTGNFTTMRIDSGTTQGYMWSYDGDNTVNVGSKSNSAFNFKVNNLTKATVDTTGNLGIGTTTPGTPLSIGNTGANTINIDSAATSTFGSGINVRTGCFAINGTCVSGGAGSGTVSSGLAGQLGWYASSGTTISGTSTGQLTVGSLLATSTTATSTFGLAVGVNGTSTPWAFLSVQSAAGVPQFAIGSSTATSFVVDKNGAVGIGTASPNSGGYSGSVLTVRGANANNIEFIRDSTSGGSSVGNFTFGNTSNSTLARFGANSGTANTRGNIFFSTSIGSSVIERMRITEDGQVAIGTTTATTVPGSLVIATTTTAQITMQGAPGQIPFNLRSVGGEYYIATSSATGQATSTQYDMRIDANGQWYMGFITTCNGATNALGVTANGISCDSGVSDARLKKEVRPIHNGLDAILKLNPITFYWKDNSDHNTASPLKQYGFVAQEVQPILPSAVGTSSPTALTPDVTYTLDKTALIAPLVSAVQELNQKIGSLKAGARSAEENWQNILIGLLIVGFFYQQKKINKLTN